MSVSSFQPSGYTRYAVLNPDGSPANPDFHIPASQVIGALGVGTVINTLPQITGATGGGGTNLDGVLTVGLSNYYAVAIRETGQGLSIWVLELDTDPVNGARAVTPPDHNPTTNARTWRQRL